MIPYLKTFFAEKDLPVVNWELTDKHGVNHFMCSTVVLEHLEIAPVHEQENIAHVIRQIDFVDGDVNDFLKHIAGAIINR